MRNAKANYINTREEMDEEQPDKIFFERAKGHNIYTHKQKWSTAISRVV